MALVFLILLGFSAPLAASESLSLWLSTTTYPYPGQFNMSCVDSSGYVYCVGGANGPSDQVFYAAVSSSGIGTWSATSSYPLRVGSTSCDASSGYVYCVGGETDSTNGIGTRDVYFATLFSNGVGTWTASTSYPYANFGQSCFVSAGYIYCVGGTGASPNKDVYYASASSAGVGAWTKTGSYPAGISGGDCVTDFFGTFITTYYVYCIGGGSDATYFAQVGSRQGFSYSPGISAWASTTGYPVGVSGASCFVENHYVYCVGGQSSPPHTAVYFAPLSPSGIAAWSATSSYPVAILTTSCVADSGYAYCVQGNLTTEVYYAQIYNIAPPSTTATTTDTLSTTLIVTTTAIQTASTVTLTAAQGSLATSTVTSNSILTTTQTAGTDLSSLGIPIGAGIAIAGAALAFALRRRR